jgi:transposase
LRPDQNSWTLADFAIQEPAANHGKNYITPGGIERLKEERHFLLTKDRPMRGIHLYNDTERSKGRPIPSIPDGVRISRKGEKVRRYDKLSRMTGSPLQRAYTWLEPDEGKLSCPVLRGGSVSNDALLPDFQGLAAQVQTALEQQPYSGHIFIFRGRRGDMVKLLWFDGDGLCLFQKRLERGRFVWPQAASGTVSLSRAQLSMLLEGIDWRAPLRTAERVLSV